MILLDAFLYHLLILFCNCSVLEHILPIGRKFSPGTLNSTAAVKISPFSRVKFPQPDYSASSFFLKSPDREKSRDPENMHLGPWFFSPINREKLVTPSPGPTWSSEVFFQQMESVLSTKFVERKRVKLLS